MERWFFFFFLLYKIPKTLSKFTHAATSIYFKKYYYTTAGTQGGFFNREKCKESSNSNLEKGRLQEIYSKLLFKSKYISSWYKYKIWSRYYWSYYDIQLEKMRYRREQITSIGSDNRHRNWAANCHVRALFLSNAPVSETTFHFLRLWDFWRTISYLENYW